MVESAVSYVWSQITSLRLLRERYFVKQIAFFGNLLQGAGHKKHVGRSSVKSMSRQLRHVKDRYIEWMEKFKEAAPILERKVIRETYNCTEYKFDNIGAGMGEGQKNFFG